jgi:hypothetical protein
MRGHPVVTTGGPDGRAPPVDIFRSLDSAAPATGDEDVAIPRSSDPDHSFPEELCDVEINTQILMVLDHGVNLNPGAGPAPLREGVASTRVSLLGSIFVACTISFSHHTCNLV